MADFLLEWLTLVRWLPGRHHMAAEVVAAPRLSA